MAEESMRQTAKVYPSLLAPRPSVNQRIYQIPFDAQ